MLRILYGTDWQHNADCLLDALCEAAGRGVSGQILIVPEQISFETEWRLCERGGDRIALSAEVLSFTRLYDRLCAIYGGAAAQIMDKSGRLVAMAGAIEQVRPRLKLYGTHVTKPEFLLQLLALYEEFCSCGVEQAGLAAAGAALGGLLAEKLEELQLIFESYEAVCRNAAQDPATRLTRLAELLTEQDYAADRQFWLDGFTDFTPQEREVIAALLTAGAEVTVSLCCDGLRGGQDVFSVPRETAASLRRTAALCGVPTEEKRLDAPEARTLRAHLAAHLFDAQTPAWEGAARVTLAEGRTPYDEALSALAGIQTLLREGVRLREIAVACTQSAVSVPILERLFARYGIRGYFAGTKEVLHEPVVRMTLAALRAASGRMEAEDVLEYLKSGAAPIGADDCDLMENYALIWQLRDNAWEKEFTRSPFGFERQWEAERADALLARLNAARKAALEPLCALRRALAAAKDTAGQVLALYGFMEQTKLAERLQAQTAALAEAGEGERAQRSAQLYEALLDAMEQIYAVLGKSVRSPEDFCRFFQAALSQYSVGTIPATLDCVHVGGLYDLRCSRAKHLFVLGATNGLLPPKPEQKSLLTQTERRALKAQGVTVAPDEGEQLSRDLLCIYSVLTSASGSLFLSCGAGQPSYLYARVKALFPQREQLPCAPLPADDWQAAALLLDGGQEAEDAALSERMQALRAQAGYERGQLSPETVRLLYGRTLYLSATRINKIASCKLAYFLENGLDADAPKPAALSRREFGNFLHKVLECTARQVMAEGGFHTVSAERTMELAEGYIEDYKNNELNALRQMPERDNWMFRRSCAEARRVVRELWEELQQSAFEPAGFELDFRNETAGHIDGRLGSAELQGKIDRVDLYTARDGRVYARVVDYKSGKKTFDYSDIWNGLNLQMLLYLDALRRHGSALLGTQTECAGVLYFPTRVDVLNSKGTLTDGELDARRHEAFKRKGLLLDNAEILRAMEPNEEEPIYLPYKRGTKEETEYLADRAQFGLLERFVQHKVEAMVDALYEGRIDADPYLRGRDEGPCKYCDFKGVCHKQSGCVPMRELAAIKCDDFWARVEREEREHGGD